MLCPPPGLDSLRQALFCIFNFSGTALVRAMTYIMQKRGQIDLINMSYGEHSQWSNAGKIGELIGEVVNKHGVIWAVSAGNAGPALCTVGKESGFDTQ